MELGKKIKQLRFKAGLTQEQLAERLGIGAQSVSKWENAVSMPDITLLPMLAEIFGVSIDDLFDLTNEQRFNRIENRMDVEEELPQDVFWEYEEFLKGQMANEETHKRATDLIANLYWHRMNSYALKVRKYAKESILLAPNEKNNQWLLNDAEGHAIWDWTLANHSKAITFYSEIVKEHPESVLSLEYLIDNLIADHRVDEAEKALVRLCALKDSYPILNETYRAHIALARYDEKKADQIMEDLLAAHPEESGCLFECAQYYAKKCNYEKAIALYEKSFEKDTKRPRFTDQLHAISEIYEIMGDYKKAAETADRLVDLLEQEWGFTEEVVLADAKKERDRLRNKA